MFYGIKSFFSSSITIGIQTTVEYTADKCISKVKIRMRFLAKYITVVCVLFLLMHAFILPSTKSSLIILDGVSTTRLIGTQSNMSPMDCRY